MARPPPGKPDSRTASDSDPVSPTGVHRKPYPSLFSDWRARTDWGHPTGDPRSDGTRRRTKEGKIGLASQTTAPGTIPYGAALYNRPTTNSIVGADIYLYSIVGAGQNTHTVRPLMCLWASIVLWAPEFTVPGECGKVMPPVSETSFLQVPTSSNLEESSSTSHMPLTILQYINSVAVAYHLLVPDGVGNKT